MKRTVCLAALAALVVSCDALAVGGIAQVTIIDRRTGVELTPYLHHGEYWVAGSPGAAYAIEIRNLLGERILAVTSVDGVNVISGATAGWNQTGYVFDPGERYQITGWRKSDAEVAAFTFTASPNSYAERTGRPANVGVIGVAVFRERQPKLAGVPQVSTPSQDRREAAGAAASPGAGLPNGRSAGLPAAPGAGLPDAPITSLPESNSAKHSDSSETQSLAPPSSVAPVPPSAPKLGTGHGKREASYVNHTEFSRMQPQPNEVIRIRYDSLENLFAMGIIERPHPVPPTTNPFPASAAQQYVPDPPAGNVE
jgi:hypothetical protein